MEGLHHLLVKRLVSLVIHVVLLAMRVTIFCLVLKYKHAQFQAHGVSKEFQRHVYLEVMISFVVILLCQWSPLNIYDILIDII